MKSSMTSTTKKEISGMNEITIVTVCYNAEKDIIKTLSSVYKQNFESLEHVIIDGGSEDNTLNIIKDFIILHNDYRPVLVSEKDNGIYDAMNKGIKKSTGKWLIFLNAGDTFFNDSVLNNIFKNLNNTTADVIYGDTNCIEGNRSYIVKGKEMKTISRRMPFCHQSVFTKRKKILEYMYNTDFKICADFDLYNRMYYSGEKFEYCGIVISNFLMTGISYQYPQRVLKENLRIRKEYSGLKHPKILYYILFFRIIFGRFAKKILFYNR